MFDFSFSEFVLCIIVFVIFVNPKKIPEFGRFLGRVLKKTNNLFFDVKEEIYREETFKKLKKIEKEIFSKNEK
ncbi:MAG: Sec-independent protein translocase subunit TatA/TatB [Methylophilaceae bacterium]|jgi:Sec-independent protein translocase protein TatA